MTTRIVLSLMGKDRVGLVDEVTQALLELGGNIETSRMARLGGEFASLMLVSLPDEKRAGLNKKLENLTRQGYQINSIPTEPAGVAEHAGWQPFRIDVLGADHEGIVHEVAHYLAQRGINIQSMETDTKPAPISATPLFSMKALVAVPPGLDQESWKAALLEVGQRANVEINVLPGNQA